MIASTRGGAVGPPTPLVPRPTTQATFAPPPVPPFRGTDVARHRGVTETGLASSRALCGGRLPLQHRRQAPALQHTEVEQRQQRFSEPLPPKKEKHGETLQLGVAAVAAPLWDAPGCRPPPPVPPGPALPHARPPPPGACAPRLCSAPVLCAGGDGRHSLRCPPPRGRRRPTAPCAAPGDGGARRALCKVPSPPLAAAARATRPRCRRRFPRRGRPAPGASLPPPGAAPQAPLRPAAAEDRLAESFEYAEQQRRRDRLPTDLD